MQDLPLDPEYSPGLYDSDTGDSLVASKVVDITEDCPTGERTILLFTQAKRGRIVQVTHPYDGQKYMGANIHFFVDELHREVDPRDDTFGLTARRAGISRSDFLKLIEDQAPVTNGDGT
jgi:hypothetical protein